MTNPPSHVPEPHRRTFLATAGALLLDACAKSPPHAVAPPSNPAPPRAPSPRSLHFTTDFDALWETTRDTYCFFDEKAVDWSAVRALYRPLAAAARTDAELLEVLDAALCELYDPHCHVNGERDGARRFLPFDLWAEWRDGRALLTAVRSDSMASAAHLSPGMEIVGLDGVPISDVAGALLPRCLGHDDLAALAWALLAGLSGRRGAPRTLTVRSPGGPPIEAALVRRAQPTPPPVSSRRAGRFGYVRIASFGSKAIVPAFDDALDDLRDTEGLVIDVRENGGGDTAFARPIMGRFIEDQKRYAWMARRAPGGTGLGPRWQELVDPRGPFTYTRPVVVLVDRFSASMAEGFPMGMRGLGRAVVVGTPMAGLGAATKTFLLPKSEASVQISAEPVYDVDGHPRWKMQPDAVVDLCAPPLGAGEDRILAVGLSTLQALAAGLPRKP